MFYDYLSTFNRAFKKLSPLRQEKARESIKVFIDFSERKIQLPHGLGLKLLRDDYWEFRTDLKDRIIIECDWSKKIVFWFVGNHDEIKKFVKSR